MPLKVHCEYEYSFWYPVREKTRDPNLMEISAGAGGEGNHKANSSLQSLYFIAEKITK